MVKSLELRSLKPRCDAKSYPIPNTRHKKILFPGVAKNDCRVFAVKFFLANFPVCFFLSRSLFNVRSRWCCNEAWHYVIQLVDRLCNDCFKLI